MKVEFFWTEQEEEINSEIEDVDNDTTDAQLLEMARDRFFETKEPAWWFKKL